MLVGEQVIQQDRRMRLVAGLSTTGSCRAEFITPSVNDMISLRYSWSLGSLFDIVYANKYVSVILNLCRAAAGECARPCGNRNHHL
jgi:hypothetical protein